VIESVIAAVYLDGGYDAAARFVVPLFDSLIDRAARSGHQENFKSVLQQHAQQKGLDTPAYRVLDEKGPDHAKAFKVCVEMGGQRYLPAWGQSKKQSEQAAALNALQELGLIETVSDGQVRVVGGARCEAPTPVEVPPPPPPAPERPAAPAKRTVRAKARKKTKKKTQKRKTTR
jgi:ribonuclease-3